MDTDRYLGGTVGGDGAVLTGTEMEVRIEGDQLLGIVTLTYTATYFTYPGATAPADDFLRAGVTTEVNGATVDNAANDVIPVRES